MDAKQPPGPPTREETGEGGPAALGARTAVRVVVALVLYGAVLFGTAGTVRYWQAWLVMGTLFVPMSGALVHFARHAPELLERRMKAREERARQKMIVALSLPAYLGVLIVPGLDQRFGWSSVPTALVVFSAVMMLAGYLFLIRVMLENRFASRTIQVEEDQELVTTGSYAIVRHPMYMGFAVMFGFMALALGSWWGLVPGLLLLLLLIPRILDEEEALEEELPGYREYMQTTTKRLLPGVW